MATTISFPTAVSTNSVTGSNLFADDGVQTTGTWNGDHADVTLSSFSSLSIPAGATINGIEVVVDGRGNCSAGLPEMKVYNGAWSSNLGFNSTFGKGLAEFDPGWGGPTRLWGLAWNATTAAAIQIQVDSSTLATGQIYWDWIKVRITYTAAAAAVMAKVNSVTDGNIARVIGKPNDEIAKINGITDTD